MHLLPFFLDRSAFARAIRALDALELKDEILEDMVDRFRFHADEMPYPYLSETLRRTDAVLRREMDEQQRVLVEEINRAALWSLQRAHYERP